MLLLLITYWCLQYYGSLLRLPRLKHRKHLFRLLIKIIATVNTFTHNQAAEKRYIQTDKPDYIIGDILWFKAYLLGSPYLHAATKTGVLYVELVNDSNQVVKRNMLPVYSGLAYGNIALTDKEAAVGGYTLRACNFVLEGTDLHRGLAFKRGTIKVTKQTQ